MKRRTGKSRTGYAILNLLGAFFQTGWRFDLRPVADTGALDNRWRAINGQVAIQRCDNG